MFRVIGSVPQALAVPVVAPGAVVDPPPPPEDGADDAPPWQALTARSSAAPTPSFLVNRL